MSKINYKFSDGLEVLGTIEQILELARIKGVKVNADDIIPKGYYLSSKMGLIEISKMTTPHIINALNKRVVAYYESIRPKTTSIGPSDIKLYLDQFVKMTQDDLLNKLYTELSNRR